MPRWNEEETKLIAIVREKLGPLLTDRPQYPEVVGDRKILRFLRGHDYKVDKVVEMITGFLNWRKEKNVDKIRDDIVNGGIDHPSKFPLGEKIISLIPQLVLAPDATDMTGAPICVEQYNFSPAKVLANLTIDEYILFIIHCLEYKMLITDQMSEHQERALIEGKSSDELEKMEPYGVILYNCVIRDLNGVGFEHLGSQGMEIIRAITSVASDNYPELMRKCYMINSPWIFNSVWYIIRAFLAPKTAAKVSVMGSGYMAEITKEIEERNVPVCIGGQYPGYAVAFPFDRGFLNPPGVAAE